jgi:hypothetical protein
MKVFASFFKKKRFLALCHIDQASGSFLKTGSPAQRTKKVS